MFLLGGVLISFSLVVEKYHEELCAVKLFSAIFCLYAIVVERLLAWSLIVQTTKKIDNCALVLYSVMGIL